MPSRKKVVQREKMALIRYCEELKSDKPELNKKTTFDSSEFNYVRQT
jgi:hypothetical protein